jgi:hypothetical protein
MLIDKIKPTVQGFTMQIIETGQHLQVQMDDLYEWMTIHTSKANTVGQFNFEMDVMDDQELCGILDGMHKHSPDKFEAIQTSPWPEPDHYMQFVSFSELEHIGQRPNMEEVQMMSQEMHQLIHAANEISEIKIDATSLTEQIRTLINKANEVISASLIITQGEPNITNLLDGYKVDRKCIRKDGTKGKYRACSKMWLQEKITTQDMQSLMIGEIIQIRAKSGQGQSNYQLKRIRIYG